MRFNRGRDGSPAGMPIIAWLLPSPTFAKKIDPLKIALRLGAGKPVHQKDLLAEAMDQCSHLVDALPPGNPGNRPDERWYWAAIAMLDSGNELGAWCFNRDTWSSIFGTPAESKTDKDEVSPVIFREHLDRFNLAMERKLELGPRPKDLVKVLAEFAIAGPGTCGLRALKRISPELAYDDSVMLSGAVRISEGFRTLFNIPTSIALLRRGPGRRYWRTTLQYSIDGNIQAVLDEQTHVLLESQGLMNKIPEERVNGVSAVLAKSLSLLPSRVKIDDIKPRRGAIQSADVNLRCRFALRFGGIIDDQDALVARADTVRESFNSPFRPFVLASTSIGQEGLDFHTWCHRVVHWNLPSNPVDLEQREGRVQRYKGHAVRKNISEKFGLNSLLDWDESGDPWGFMFDRAVAQRPPGAKPRFG
ncbi:MAG: helicase-related protein [Candidatus Binatia bacterium]